MAVKQGGPDINSNAKLKDVVAKCKSNNMPSDNIERSIKKAAGEGEANYEEVVYEGYGPGGVAVIVEGTTDNRNRTAGEVRHIFDKFGGNLGATGCVSYMFDRKGVIIIEKESVNVSEEELMLTAIEAGAEDFESGDEYYEITTTVENYNIVREEMGKQGIKFESAELEMVPKTLTTLDDNTVKKMELLIEKLEELDDVADIYHNWEE